MPDNQPGRSAAAPDEDVEDELHALLDVWGLEQTNADWDVKPILKRIAELLEDATEAFHLNNPDPMDDRHPSKSMPQCKLGHLLKIVLDEEEFINKLVISYLLARDNTELNVLSARLVLALMPGLDTNTILSDADHLIEQLYKWAEHSDSRELSAYSMSILGAAMDSEHAHTYRTQNATLIPIALQRLRTLYAKMLEEYKQEDEAHRMANGGGAPSGAFGPTDFSGLLNKEKAGGSGLKTPEKAAKPQKPGPSKSQPSVRTLENERNRLIRMFHSPDMLSRLRVTQRAAGLELLDSVVGTRSERRPARPTDGAKDGAGTSTPTTSRKRRQSESDAVASGAAASVPIEAKRTKNADGAAVAGGSRTDIPSQKRAKPTPNAPARPVKTVVMFDAGYSNSSFQRDVLPLLVGKHKLYPLSTEMEQRMILQYLVPTCEYQDNLSIVMEHRALDVILNYLDVYRVHDIRLLFDALRYLSAMLIHRKFAWEFIASQGVEKLLRVNRNSMASTAVATCLYYLAYSSDIMEKVCHLADAVLDLMVDYAAWLLDHSHESGRASAAMFMAYGLTFRPILERFEKLDGLRRLYNYIATLAIVQRNFQQEEELNEDHMGQSILTMKNAFSAFQTYLKSHMFIKIEHLKRTQSQRLASLDLPVPAKIPSVLSHNKCMHMDEDTVREAVNMLLHAQTFYSNWRPIEEMRRLGIIELLLHIVANYPDWAHNGRYEPVKLILEVLWLATTSPKVQLDMCTIPVKSGVRRPATTGIT